MDDIKELIEKLKVHIEIWEEMPKEDFINGKLDLANDMLYELERIMIKNYSK